MCESSTGICISCLSYITFKYLCMRKYFLLHFLTVKILLFLFQKSPQEVPIVDTVVLSENGNGEGNGM